MERRKFTREFKLEAVKLVKDRGVSYARAAEDLGVHPTQLRSWVKALADDPQHSFLGQGQMKPARERKALRHRGPPHDPIEGLSVEQDRARDGLQTARGRTEKLAPSR